MMKPDGTRRGEKFSDRVGGQQTLDERRVEPRVVANIPATVRALTPIGSPYPATLIEVSQRGVGLRVDRKFPPGAAIQVVVSTEVFVGKVLHCKCSGDDFILGVTLSV